MSPWKLRGFVLAIVMLMGIRAHAGGTTTWPGNGDAATHYLFHLGDPSLSPDPTSAPALFGGHLSLSIPVSQSGLLTDLHCIEIGGQLTFLGSDGVSLACRLIPYASLTGVPTSLPPSGAAGGVLTGTYPNPGLNLGAGGITGQLPLADLAQGGASTNQLMTWLGSTWGPAPAPTSGINQLTGDGTAGPGSGSQAFTLHNIPSATTLAGYIDVTPFAPTTGPPPGHAYCSVDPANLTWMCLNAWGISTHGVRSSSGANFITGIAPDGSITRSGVNATQVAGLWPVATSGNGSDLNPGSTPLDRLSQSGASVGNVPTWNGTAWAPASAGASGITALTGGGTAGPGSGSQVLTLNLGAGATVTGVLPLSNQAAPSGTGVAGVTSGAWDAAATTVSTGLHRAAGALTADLSVGVSGGQAAIGGTGSGENLTLSTTSNATKGKLIVGSTSTFFVDEQNLTMALGTSTLGAGATVQVNKSINGSNTFAFSNPSVGANAYGSFILANAASLATQTFGMYLGGSAASFGSPFNANAGVIELNGGTADMVFWQAQSGGDFVWNAGTTFPNPTVRMRLTNAGVLSVPGLGTAMTKTVSGALTPAVAGSDFELPLTFSTGLHRAVNTITADLSTGVAGGQTAFGGTAASEILTLSSTAHATKGEIDIGAAGQLAIVEARGDVVVGTGLTTSATGGFLYLPSSNGIPTGVPTNYSSFGVIATEIDRLHNRLYGYIAPWLVIGQYDGTFGPAIIKTDASGIHSAAVAGTDFESPLTFSTGLTRAVNTVTANLSTGKAGGQTAFGGTAASEVLTLSSTAHATKGEIDIGVGGQLAIVEARGDVVVGSGLATGATGGFLYLPSTNGVPTGVPTTYSSFGVIATVVDRLHNRLYTNIAPWLVMAQYDGSFGPALVKTDAAGIHSAATAAAIGVTGDYVPGTAMGKIWSDSTDAANNAPDYLYPKLTSFTSTISFSPTGTNHSQVTVDLVPAVYTTSFTWNSSFVNSATGLVSNLGAFIIPSGNGAYGTSSETNVELYAVSGGDLQHTVANQSGGPGMPMLRMVPKATTGGIFSCSVWYSNTTGSSSVLGLDLWTVSGSSSSAGNYSRLVHLSLNLGSGAFTPGPLTASAFTASLASGDALFVVVDRTDAVGGTVVTNLHFNCEAEIY